MKTIRISSRILGIFVTNKILRAVYRVVGKYTGRIEMNTIFDERCKCCGGKIEIYERRGIVVNHCFGNRIACKHIIGDNSDSKCSYDTGECPVPFDHASRNRLVEMTCDAMIDRLRTDKILLSREDHDNVNAAALLHHISIASAWRCDSDVIIAGRSYDIGKKLPRTFEMVKKCDDLDMVNRIETMKKEYGNEFEEIVEHVKNHARIG
jgi:hypothetical protein